MASKRKVRRRVAKALKKYVRGNPAKYEYVIQAGDGPAEGYDEPYSSRKEAMAMVKWMRKHLFRPESDPRFFWLKKQQSKSNPPRVKGRKTKGGRAVTLKNFTGTIVKKSDGTVQIVGRGKRK